jgi:hypothetical protein
MHSFRFKFFVTLVTALLCNAVAFAYNITGSATDSGGEPLIQASVRLLNPKDSTVVNGAVTNENGRFNVKNVKQGKYLVEVSYVGFSPAYRTVSVSNSNVNAGSFKLDESSVMLKEATVVGIKTPIKVMDDTIEFNADSYKTAPNAVVEDLLKRLPGVEVDSQGKITANGKEVSKILVDGKEFFSDDPKVASKNLPVQMVDKLQVVDRKSDLARITGVDDGEEETVINLTVKKGMKEGWFGNIEAGYGTDDRYKGSFIVNRFWNDNQLTFVGGANNTNELAFTDGNGGRFSRFGGNTGVNKSQSFGVNFNVGNGEILRVGGDVMYSRSDRDTRQTTDRQYLLADEDRFYKSSKTARDIGNNVRADFRIQWKPDSFNTVDIRPNFSYNHNNSTSYDESLTYRGLTQQSNISQSVNRSGSNGDSYEFGARFIYNHNFKRRRGRSFSIHANYSMSNVREYANTYSWNKFFLLADSVDLYDQYSNNHTWSNTVSARATWTEPLGNVKNGNFITVAYNIQYRWNNADKLVYDHSVEFPNGWDGDAVIGTDNILNEELSNRFRNNYMNQDIRAGFKHVSKATLLDVGLSLVPQMSSSTDLINSARNIPTRHVLNYAPYLRYRLKANKQRSLNLDYRGRSSQPSMSQLQPVADVSNPLKIVQGNPNLDPSFTHNIRLRFQDFNADAQRSIMAMVDGQVVQNSIVSRTSYNSETGGQVTTYENVNGVWNVRGMTMFSVPFRNKAFTFNNHIMLSYSNSIGYSNDMRNRSGSFSGSESFGIAWRPDNLELEIRPSYNIQNVSNTVQQAANRTVHTYGASLNGTYYTPFGIVLNTDLNFSGTKGYSEGYDTNQWLWNASISYQFLRGKAATVTLQGYDLLQQRTNIMRTVTANYIDDIRYNSLTRYFMVSFAYKFNTFGKNGTPKDRNAERWGDGPPPGEGRPGGGPGGPGGPGGGGRPPM